MLGQSERNRDLASGLTDICSSGHRVDTFSPWQCLPNDPNPLQHAPSTLADADFPSAGKALDTGAPPGDLHPPMWSQLVPPRVVRPFVHTQYPQVRLLFPGRDSIKHQPVGTNMNGVIRVSSALKIDRTHTGLGGSGGRELSLNARAPRQSANAPRSSAMLRIFGAMRLIHSEAVHRVSSAAPSQLQSPALPSQRSSGLRSSTPSSSATRDTAFERLAVLLVLPTAGAASTAAALRLGPQSDRNDARSCATCARSAGHPSELERLR